MHPDIRRSVIVDAASVQRPLIAQNDNQVEANWATAQSALRRWEVLQAGWDGEHAPSPSTAALAGCRTFLEQARVASVAPPAPYITSDAELGFRWSKDDGFASVSFADDGNIVAFCRQPGSSEALRIDAPFVDLDLTALFDGIRRLV